MKKIKFFLIPMIAWIVFSCNSKKTEDMSAPSVITEKIDYDVLINNPDSTLDFWIQNLEGPAREKLVNVIIQSALSGKYELQGCTQDPETGFFKVTGKITPDVIEKLIKPRSVNMMVQEKEGKKPQMQSVILFDHDPAKINKIKFLEKWTLDEKTFVITKEVLGVAPMIDAFGDTSLFGGNKYFFFIKTDTGKATKFEKITDKIQYDVQIVSNEPGQDWWVNNIEKSYRVKMLNTLLNKVKSGDLKAYHILLNTPLTKTEVNDILAQEKVKQLQRAEPPYELYDTIIKDVISPDNIIRMRFVEEWEVSINPFKIQKKILAIAPIKENYAPDGTLRGYTPLFWIFFDKKLIAK